MLAAYTQSAYLSCIQSVLGTAELETIMVEKWAVLVVTLLLLLCISGTNSCIVAKHVQQTSLPALHSGGMSAVLNAESRCC